MERDPTKRKVKPAQALFDFEDLGESSDDSDFRIEDHCEDSDDDSIDSDDNGQENDYSEGSGNCSDGSELAESIETLHKPLEDATTLMNNTQAKKSFNPKNALNIMICSVCLGERSDATNEIIECDNCGVTVHEGCYGVQDSDSVCSTDSPCPTTPWFCDACKAGITQPECELCPNSGGIFKETDVGKWVHLVCALYMPGVAFAEVDRLSSVTLFEMSYTKWGSKSCSLCVDQRLSRTGVAVPCDAGMCKTHFHVTCGQKEGLLAEAHSEEVDQADPFYAHCKLHSDKTLTRKRRRNWLALQMRAEQISLHKRDDIEENRIKRRLSKYRTKYNLTRLGRAQPWVPTQKMSRLLTTSASACRKLWRKAELSGADTRSWELRQAQVQALSDVHRRWHIQPAFSVEFIGYYLDRNVRVSSMRKQLAELLEENSKLLDEQAVIEEKRDAVVTSNEKEYNRNKDLKSTIEVYYKIVQELCPSKKIPNLELIGTPPPKPPVAFTMGVPTPAALKAGVGFPLRSPVTVDTSMEKIDEDSVSINNSCGLCYGRNDQHLLAKCDTCRHYYHLGCLNPPLTRMPKKTKLMGWQCSECDKDSENSDVECVDPEAPRKLRGKEFNAESGDSAEPKVAQTLSRLQQCQVILNRFEPKVNEEAILPLTPVQTTPDVSIGEIGWRGGKKRRREKHHRYSPEPGRPHKHKHKRPKAHHEHRHSLKICFKSIPHPTGEGSAYVATPSSELTPRSSSADTSLRLTPSSLTKKKEEAPILCVTCNTNGTSANLVRCDECLKGFHFACLDPPVKKSPKVRGYSWHCANCDPTESE